MGEAKRRKALGLTPRKGNAAPMRVRQITLDLPVELAERLDKLCPPKWHLREWLVGSLSAFAEWAEQEKQREAEKDRLVVPYYTVPRRPPGPPSLPPHTGPKQWA